MLVDTHCHLDFDAFDEDRAAVVENARRVGVQRILNPGVDLASSRAALALSSQYPEVYAAVGVHPNDGLTWGEFSEANLDDLAGQPKVVAIGEIGLDYFRERAPRLLQAQILRRQLALAAKHNLPVIIHLRNEMDQHNATENLLGILSEWVQDLVSHEHPLSQNPGVIHSFSENSHYASQAIVINFLLGITGPVTFRKADELQQVVASFPIEKLLIETDAPFLTPHPFRGRRNEPAHVRWVAEKIAEIQGIPVDEAKTKLFMNAERLFHW